MSAEPPRTSPGAVVSLVLGLLSLLLSLLAAVPAWVVGLHALRAIHGSDGRLRGRPLAIAGMALGAAGGVVSLLGIAAMILLHLNTSRDRTECANNLRQIGLAVSLYHDKNGDHFPPATVPAADLPPEKRLSWYVAVLPYLEQGPAARAWKPLLGQFDTQKPWEVAPNSPAATTRVATFVCRSSRYYDPSSPPGMASYVGFTGVDPDAAVLPATDPRAGFFGYDRMISRNDVRAGISNTMMAGETDIDVGHWSSGGPSTARGLNPFETDFVGLGRPYGGLHAGGANVLWVDGSVRFVRDGMEAETFRLLATLGARREGGPPP